MDATQLVLGASIIIYPSSGSKSYVITDIWLGKNTNFSNDGNRLISISDGTHVYSAITSALLLTQVNTKWGGTGVPLPATASITQPTTPGANIIAVYSGGSADYSTGLVDISINLMRVA